MPMKGLISAFLLLAALLLTGCEENGPGMTVTWETLDPSRYISLESIRLPSGLTQNRSTAITFSSPKVEGFAPDSRVIPTWVELSWIEPVEYSNDRTAPSMSERIAAIHQLPLKTQRVEVGSRIPKEVIDQVMEAKRNRRPKELPDKHIEVYFTWHDGVVSFRWELVDRTLEPGGKVIASGS